LIRDEDGIELYQAQSRQEYRVLVKDFPQFCKDMKLNHAEMEKVVTGKQREHKGWIGAITGNPYDMGSPYMPPAYAGDQDAPEHPHIPQPKEKRLMNFAPFQERIDWTPAKK